MYTSSHLDEDLAQGDEGRAELSQKQAADEEIPLVLSEELWHEQTHDTKSEETRAGMESKIKHS